MSAHMEIKVCSVYTTHSWLVHSKFQEDMDKFSLMANFGIVLVFSFIVYSARTGASTPSQKLEKLNLRCDINNSKYWDIIEWYFERASHVIVTFITQKHTDKLDFSTVFLKQLATCKCHLSILKIINLLVPNRLTVRLTFYLENVDYYNEGDPVSLADTFDWKGQKFELRTTEKLVRNKRQIESTRKPGKKRKQHRLDEPERGALVFAHRVDVIDKYLIGTPRS